MASEARRLVVCHALFSHSGETTEDHLLRIFIPPRRQLLRRQNQMQFLVVYHLRCP